MRLGWTLHAGPFWLSRTIWRSRPRRRKAWHGTLGDRTCPHNHQREDTARSCARAEARANAHGDSTW